MILKISGEVNRYYVQTLCMVFFPGATFPENQEEGGDVPTVEVALWREGNQQLAKAKILWGDKQSKGEGSAEFLQESGAPKAGKIAVGRAIFAAGKAFFSYSPQYAQMNRAQENTFFSMRNIVKQYQMGEEVQTILKGIDLDITEGEFLSVLGPSGSGKSTLMNIIG